MVNKMLDDWTLRAGHWHLSRSICPCTGCSENESLPTAYTPTLWPLCCRGWLQLQRLSLSAQAITGPICHICSVLWLIFFILSSPHTMVAQSQPCERDPASRERYNRMSALTINLTTRLQCTTINRTIQCDIKDVMRFQQISITT